VSLDEVCDWIMKYEPVLRSHSMSYIGTVNDKCKKLVSLKHGVRAINQT